MKVVEDKKTNIEEKMEKFDKIHDKIKYKAFGKVTITQKKQKYNHIERETDESKDEKEKEIYEKQEKMVNDEVEEIKRMKLSKVGKVWEIRKRVVGEKKTEQNATAILDPKTGNFIVSRNKIKEVSLEYCKNTLANHEPHADYEKEINAKKNEVRNKLLEHGGELNINRETFDSIVSKFKKSRKRNYDFLVRAGKVFQSAVFRFCQVMMEEETFPTSFQETTLHMIFKGGKGRRENLTENRFIHSKSWLPRTAEAILVEEGLKESLIEGSSMHYAEVPL